MVFDPSIFRAYDIRGLIGPQLNPELAELVGRALANFLPTEGPVCVGYDMRSDSAELAAALREGLMQQGRTVIDIGEVPSDMIYFAVGELGAAGGAMVTASHNPGKYNGIKLCGEAARPIGIESGLAEIREAVRHARFKTAQRGAIEQRDLMRDWMLHATSFIDVRTINPKLRLAIDAGNGMAGLVAAQLQNYIPALQVEPLFCELDGSFPNHPANPTIEANNQDLAETITRDELDFGFAFDGDGDRAYLLDDRGQTVPGHIMSALLAKYFLTLNPGAEIVVDIRNSRLVRDVIIENGGTPVLSRVGHSFIKAKMRERDAPFGGEFSGHYYFRDNYYADSGLIAAIVMIQIISDAGQKVSELIAPYASRYARSPELNFTITKGTAALADLAQRYADGTQSMLDGLSVDYPDWWFNVRPSNTEPLIRLNIEATSTGLLARKVAELTARLYRYS